MLRNKNAIECWNILKYEIESIIDKFVSLKKKPKENDLQRDTCQNCGIRHDRPHHTAATIVWLRIMWRRTCLADIVSA